MGSRLSKAYPDVEDWKKLVKEFTPDAIAHKLLLAHIPYVFRDEPIKFALFRTSVAEVFKIEPSNVFIVGSAMAGRSLKGKDIEKEYSPDSDIDALIVSEPLFTKYVMESLEWVRLKTAIDKKEREAGTSYSIDQKTMKSIAWFSAAAGRGIWRPDSLPGDAPSRIEFFDCFSKVSLKTLGLQLSDDTVAKVTGRIARSYEDAKNDLAYNIKRLRNELHAEPDDTAHGFEPEDIDIDDSVPNPIDNKTLE